MAAEVPTPLPLLNGLPYLFAAPLLERCFRQVPEGFPTKNSTKQLNTIQRQTRRRQHITMQETFLPLKSTLRTEPFCP